MRATAALFLIFALAHAWGFNHAKNTPADPFHRDRCPADVVQSSGTQAPDVGDGQAGRDVSSLPFSPRVIPTDAPAPVPSGTRWVLSTGQELDTVDDSAAERIRVCNENANCITF